ncbi:MAG: hypothetical protein DCF25_16335, partial [Leptolyngbya foveolarum]
KAKPICHIAFERCVTPSGFIKVLISNPHLQVSQDFTYFTELTILSASTVVATFVNCMYTNSYVFFLFSK